MQSLREYRQRCKLTQTELATMLGVSQPAICQWETGVNVPSPTMTVALAGVLNIPLEELIGDISEKERTEGRRGLFSNDERWLKLLQGETLDNRLKQTLAAGWLKQKERKLNAPDM